MQVLTRSGCPHNIADLEKAAAGMLDGARVILEPWLACTGRYGTYDCRPHVICLCQTHYLFLHGIVSWHDAEPRLANFCVDDATSIHTYHSCCYAAWQPVKFGSIPPCSKCKLQCNQNIGQVSAAMLKEDQVCMS